MGDMTPGAAGVESSAIRNVMAEHASRGLKVQAMLRMLLALFVIGVVAFDPPVNNEAATVAVAVLYAAWCLLLHAVLLRRPRLVGRLAVISPFVDMLALTVLAVLASRSNVESWTSDILIAGFALIPVIAATQLSPEVSAVVAVPTVVVYFLASVAGRVANGHEPWSSILLRTGVIAALCLGSVWLSRIQRSRVDTIAVLARDRSLLLDEVLQIEARERGLLAESLDDGALQYVLAARQELGDLHPESGGMGMDGATAAGSLDRVDDALRQTTTLLRTTLTGLRPAALELHGLASALDDAVKPLSANGIQVLVDTAGWPAGTTAVDQLLFATARELLQNVVKHARAGRVEVTAECADGQARLVIVDDGVGISEAAADSERQAARLRDGHLGLISRRVRLEAQGGALSIGPAPNGGTVAIALVPMPAVDETGH